MSHSKWKTIWKMRMHTCTDVYIASMKLSATKVPLGKKKNHKIVSVLIHWSKPQENTEVDVEFWKTGARSESKRKPKGGKNKVAKNLNPVQPMWSLSNFSPVYKIKVFILWMFWNEKHLQSVICNTFLFLLYSTSNRRWAKVGCHRRKMAEPGFVPGSAYL